MAPPPHIRRARLLLALVTAAFVLLLATPAVAAAPRISDQPALSAAIVERINEFRRDHGLRRLDVASGLVRAARGHTQAMATEGFFSHSRQGASVNTRLARYYAGAGTPGWAVGEAMFWKAGRASAAEVVSAWLRSPAHHRVLRTAAWDHVGVSAIVAENAPGVYGGRTVTIVVADFGTRG